MYINKYILRPYRNIRKKHLKEFQRRPLSAHLLFLTPRHPLFLQRPPTHSPFPYRHLGDSTPTQSYSSITFTYTQRVVAFDSRSPPPFASPLSPPIDYPGGSLLTNFLLSQPRRPYRPAPPPRSKHRRLLLPIKTRRPLCERNRLLLSISYRFGRSKS